MSGDIVLLEEELSPATANLIEESSRDGKNVWLSGVYMQAELKNRNGRVYPLQEIANAVNVANERIKDSNGILGELDHPQTLTINLDRVSHVITEMRMEGNNAYGKARLMDTPMGNIARELVNAGVRLGVSSRGAGSVGTDGGVQSFQFVTVDIVAQPSAPGAVPDSIYESLMHNRHGAEAVSLAEQVRHDPAAQKYFKREFQRFLSENLFVKK
jgi:hypothetical protein